MKTARYLGVSFYRSRLQVAEVEHGKKVQVTALAERESTLDMAQAGVNLTGNHPQLATFVGELRDLIKQNKLKAEYVSFAFPPDPVFLNIIPVDASLTGAELQKYLHWELEQYFPGGEAGAFIVDSHALPQTDSASQVRFVAGVRKGMVAFVQKAAGELKLKLNIVDIDQFSTEKTLLINYPEILEHDIVLFGFRYGGMDASLIHEGQMTDYRAYNAGDPKKTVQHYLKYLKGRNGTAKPAALLLHGMEIKNEMVLALRTETGIQQTVALNALRRVPVAEGVYKPYLKESYRFAAAIGLALRTT